MTRPKHVYPDAEEVDDNPWEEAAEACLRRELGLRPIAYSLATDAPHPDDRPCPSWCTSKINGWGHEVVCDGWVTARHRPDVTPSIAASQYVGVMDHHRDDWAMLTPTIEFQVEQYGQGFPTISVNLRGGVDENDDRAPYRELLELSMTDAREMVTVLNYLLEMMERG